MSLSKDDKRMIVNIYRSIVIMMTALASKDTKTVEQAKMIDENLESQIEKWIGDKK